MTERAHIVMEAGCYCKSSDASRNIGRLAVKKKQQHTEMITNVKQEHIYMSLAPGIQWTLFLFKFGNPKAVRKQRVYAQS